jgi:Flp pilus assembly protein TadG
MRSIVSVARFIASEAGALALSFAIAAPALLVMAGMATDYAFMVRYRTELQAVADAAAIAGARELSLAKADASQITAAVDNFVKVNSANRGGTVSISTTIQDDQTAVEVSLSRNWAPFFAHFVARDVTPINASATARLVGSTKVCVIGLDESEKDTVRLDNSATLTANNCAVYSNSTSTQGLYAANGTRLKSALSCVAGGFVGSISSFDPQPLTDCPKIADPLVDRAPPPVPACNYNKLTLNKTNITLFPGVYCGGLKISDSIVNFDPGVYIIRGGYLEFSSKAQIYGANVGFYLIDGSLLKIVSDTSIELTAPKDGSLAGLLFFEDRSATTNGTHSISSDDARVLLGTIYLSRGTLVVDASKPVADQSAYTAIVARTLRLKAGPNLVLNSDYGSTDIPVPAGLKNLAGGRIALSN